MRNLLIVFVLGLSGFVQAQNIVRLEYFLDTDPGFGKAEPLDFGTAATDIAKEFILPLDTVSPGFHILYARAQDAKGVWSITAQRILYNQSYKTNGPAVSRIEYFVDNDPGFGKATSIVFASDTLDFEAPPFILETDTLNLGFHILYVRAQDSSGDWSLTAQRIFYLEKANGALAKVSRLEYYYYTSDGKIAGDSLYTYNIPTPAASVDLTFPATVAPLENDKNYILYIWAFNENDVRSLVAIRPFTYSEGQPKPPITLTAVAENIPCAGDSTGRITVNATGGEGMVYSISTDSANYTANKVFENLAAGTYTVYVHDADTSNVASQTVEITAPATALSLALSGEVQQTSCENPESGSFTVIASGGAEAGYMYSLDSGAFQESNVFENLAAGNYTVTAQDSSGCTATLEVAVNSTGEIPATPVIELNGDAGYVELTTVLQMVVNNVTGNFQWYKDGVAIPNATTKQLEISDAGSYTVTVTSQAGCSATSEPEVITGIDDALSSVVKVYPNPTEQQLFVELPDAFRGSGTVRLYVYDMQGALLISQSVSFAQIAEVNLSALSQGTYLLVMHNEQSTLRKKIQKM